ncbi:ABC transporter ATP-binding protein [Candidatus Woesearchaeota archaeon]|nr:ABC transporter ATP-binding protein [Candidatus Woesearchaeota archaeon]
MLEEKVLEIKGLHVSFPSSYGEVKAVSNVNLDLHKKETLGLVGESGCGKSVTSLSILKLLPPQAKIQGEIYFKNQNILTMDNKELRRLRGKEIAMIFQDPMSSLNPVFTVGDQIGEALKLHQKMNKKEAKERTIELLKLVKIPDPEKRINDYPHVLSGGMSQRAMIAMALACNPTVLIADEPTTALDVTVQAQILELMGELKEKIDSSIILITHNLGVIAEVADNVAVMYAGKIVEYGNKKDVFKNSKHPYTLGLLESVPKRGEPKLKTIEGVVPELINLPPGCSFAPRCNKKTDQCTKITSELEGEYHKTRCLVYQTKK